MTLFTILLSVGLLLVVLEIFVPGGILGSIAAVILLAAIIVAYLEFNAATATGITVGILFLCTLAIGIAIKYVPNSPIGRMLTLNTRTLKDAKAVPNELEGLIDKEGVALSDLRPSGFAKIDGRRRDVVTEGNMIDKGVSVRVVDVEGNRVVVRKIEEST